jgi:Zn finger protein HypA/HybF involved in hydrogenase expression
MEQQPKTIPNPLWCDTCEGRRYVIVDAEWEPYAVRCPDCKDPHQPGRA